VVASRLGWGFGNSWRAGSQNQSLRNAPLPEPCSIFPMVAGSARLHRAGKAQKCLDRPDAELCICAAFSPLSLNGCMLEVSGLQRSEYAFTAPAPSNLYLLRRFRSSSNVKHVHPSEDFMPELLGQVDRRRADQVSHHRLRKHHATAAAEQISNATTNSDAPTGCLSMVSMRFAIASKLMFTCSAPAHARCA